MSLFEHAYRIREALAIRRARIKERAETKRRLADVRRLPIPELRQLDRAFLAKTVDAANDNRLKSRTRWPQ